MDFFDFFFPEQAQATHLRKISNRRAVPTRSASDSSQASEVASLREDVNFLSLVIAAILKRLSETEHLSLGDVRDLFDEIDALDGVADSGLDPSILRGLLGVLKAEKEDESNSESDEFKIVTAPRYRK